MNRSPVADWQQLSALYEVAVALDPESLEGWLQQLRQRPHPLFSQLQQMLDARSQIQGLGFLGTLPKIRLEPEPAPRAVEWKAGSLLGVYRLQRRIGTGGMAEVWLAQRDDGVFDRQVAIKLLFRNERSDERDSFAQRFERERHILASLDHPNIAGLHDAGVTRDGQPWLALEYVEGQLLTTWCDARHLGVRERVQLFQQVLLAVQHAHANLVIHRDLKPGNILVTAQGDVRLLDFGIAKLIEPDGGTSVETELTRLGGRPMTPQYAAPEQLLGQPLTTACDVYALGVVLYELLCGELPYELKVDTAAQLEQAILDAEPRAPSRRALQEPTAMTRGTSSTALRKVLASDLDAIVLRALAKSPAQRYGSVEALRTDLDRWLTGETVEARAPSTVYRVGKFVRRHAVGVSLGVAAVLGLVGVTAVAVVMGLQAREDSARAVAARDFMLGLFKRADQEKARGADITARELLETGRKDLLTRLAEQPRLQVELLLGIGTIQRDMGEYAGADSSYAEAARVYGRLRMHREAALALTEQANAATRAGNLPLAHSVLQRAKNARVDGREADPALSARISEVEGWVNFAQRDYPRARDLFIQSYEHSRTAFGPFGPKTRDAIRGQMYAERQLRNFQAALRLLDSLESAVANGQDVDATDVAAIATDRADLLFNLEHFDRSLEVATAASPRCAADLGPNHMMCRTLLLSKVNAMLKLGLTERAVEELPALESIANDRNSPALRASSLLTVLRIDSASGNRVRQESSFVQVMDLVDSNIGSTLGSNFKTQALLSLAEVRLRAADPLASERLLDRAISFQRRSDGTLPMTMEMARAKSLRGIALLERGLGAKSLQILSEGRSDLSKLSGPNAAAASMVSMNLALALERLSRSDEALVIVNQAEPLLRDAMGPNAPTYLRVRGMQDRLVRARLAAPSGELAAVPAESGRASQARHRPLDFFA